MWWHSFLVLAMLIGLSGPVAAAGAAQDAERAQAADAPLEFADRSGVRAMQDALSFFGFDAGRADGALGPKTRDAIRQFQQFIGAEATGRMTGSEHTRLVGAHALAELDPLISFANARALLLPSRAIATSRLPDAAQDAVPAPAEPDMLAEVAPEDADDPVVVGRSMLPVLEAGPAPSEQTATKAPVKTTLGDANAFRSDDLQLPQIPQRATRLATSAAGRPSGFLASHCYKIDLLVTARGGFSEVGGARPDLALAEQFCVARAQAMAQGFSLLTDLAEVSFDTAQQECTGFEALLAPVVANFTAGDGRGGLRAASELATNSGLSPRQLDVTTRVCLAVGYESESFPLVLGATLVRVASGHVDHAEILAHHARDGFGMPRNLPYAEMWFRLAISALEEKEATLFAGEGQARADLLTWALGYNVRGFSSARGSVPGQEVTQQRRIPIFEMAPRP